MKTDAEFHVSVSPEVAAHYEKLAEAKGISFEAVVTAALSAGASEPSPMLIPFSAEEIERLDFIGSAFRTTARDVAHFLVKQALAGASKSAADRRAELLEKAVPPAIADPVETARLACATTLRKGAEAYAAIGPSAEEVIATIEADEVATTPAQRAPALSALRVVAAASMDVARELADLAEIVERAKPS